MNKPELYHAANNLQTQITLECLREYAQRTTWNKTGDTAIDVGCGDGRISVILKNYASNSYKKFVACDINTNMIEFASKRYADEDIFFQVVDIGGHVSEDLGVFNHVFSFFTLHWVKNQEKAFKNIYNLLTDDGDIFVTLIGNNAVFSVYKVLAQKSKWNIWLREVDMFVSPYHEVQNPEKKLKEIVVKCGFKNVHVSSKIYPSFYDNTDGLKQLLHSVEPFNMPSEVFDELFEDFCAVGEEMGVMKFNKNRNSDAPGVTYDTTLLIIAANK